MQLLHAAALARHVSHHAPTEGLHENVTVLAGIVKRDCQDGRILVHIFADIPADEYGTRAQFVPIPRSWFSS